MYFDETKSKENCSNYVHYIISYHQVNGRFFHPNIYQYELEFKDIFGLYSWDDTGCLGKHAYVEEFFEGRNVTATGFNSATGSTKYPTIKYILHAYDI